MTEMVIAALVLMAADTGDLDSTEDIDVLLRALLHEYGDHRDTTWREVMDALLDLRTLVVSRPLVEAALV